MPDAKARAKRIIPHITTAISFIAQSFSGPQEVSFLPAYYAILNLAKVYILLGPRHADLPQHRWHGATYDVEGKDSHSLLTEEITLKKGGALALFYETLTGRPIAKERLIKMRDVYPYIVDISAEYRIATGRDANIVGLEFKAIPANDKGEFRLRVRTFPRDVNQDISVKSLAVLRGFTKNKGEKNQFTSPVFYCKTDEITSTVRTMLACQYLFFAHLQDNVTETAITASAFPLPEEFPIALLFFHMSSVVRYKPEVLERLQKGKFWPVLATARRHSLFKFILLFWSYIHQEHFIIRSA